MYEYGLSNIRVIDGDTIEADVLLGFGITIRRDIRLSGINTPETRTRDLTEKDFGKRVTRLVENEINNGIERGDDICLRSERDKSGKYGRLLGSIHIGNLDLNRYLLNARYAIVYGADKSGHMDNWEYLRENDDSLFSDC